MTSRAYDTFKFVALVILPGLGALYFGAAEIWGLPYAAQVVGTISLVDTFLGLILKKSSSNYRDNISNPPVLGDLYLRTDYDGVPTGNFRLSASLNNVVFEPGKLVALKVKQEVEKRPGETH